MDLEISLSPGIQKQPELAALVANAEPTLRRIVGETLEDPKTPVRARWDLESGVPGHEQFLLTLADFSGEVSDSYSREELAKADELWPHMHWQWGDLLHQRVRFRLKELREAMATAE